MNQQGLLAGSSLHPKPPSITYTYGTAGFRTNADVLDSVLYRVGLLASLRSKNLGGKAIGVMVTASHNPERDNGVKLVDPMGEMLVSSWETYATKLANCQSDSELVSTFQQIAGETQTDLMVPATVIYGYDTRPSCPSLVKSLEDGLNAMDSKLVGAGLCSTPILHYLVRCTNTQGTEESYGEPTIEGYYKKLAKAYTILAKGRHLLPALTVDCANGVGAPVLKSFASHLSSDILPLILSKDDVSTPGQLNLNCGADYVKTQQRSPPGVSLIPNQRYCSYDGDADRIVFYYSDDSNVFHLLDGDKIAGLSAGFIMDLVKDSGLSNLKVGVVQTAYANGASTKYLTQVLGVPVTCVPTGVKHLHHSAQSYDIGVYFEANGHGTVLFSPSTLSTISSHTPSNPSEQSALLNLRALIDVINQTVGDALSDMLLVETVLLHRQWLPSEWDSAYSDLPNRLVKVYVKDRHAFTTEDAERKVVTPQGLQAKVDQAVGAVEGGRSFVRPSGTEDCVRVYAEAKSRETADELAQKVAGIVFDLAGSGERPSKFT